MTRDRSAWLYIAPLAIGLLLTAAWPLLRTIWLAFTDARLGSMSAPTFIGFENFLYRDGDSWRGLLADRLWWRSVGNTLWFTAVSVTFETLFGVIVALALNVSFRGRGLLRAAVLVPWAIPTVVSAQMWRWMLHDQFGILNTILLGVGILSEPLAWTADPDLALSAVVMVDVWKTTPFMALLVLAALQSVPGECYEAARVDGAGPVMIFFRITLPLIRPALLVAVIFRTLDAIRIFDLIYVLTAGSEETMSMSVFARQQLVDFQRVGYGSAAATLLFFGVALLTAVYLVLARVEAE